MGWTFESDSVSGTHYLQVCLMGPVQIPRHFVTSSTFLSSPHPQAWRLSAHSGTHFTCLFSLTRQTEPAFLPTVLHAVYLNFLKLGFLGGRAWGALLAARHRVPAPCGLESSQPKLTLVSARFVESLQNDVEAPLSPFQSCGGLDQEIITSPTLVFMGLLREPSGTTNATGQSCPGEKL